MNFVDDDRMKCTQLLALQVAAIGDFKAIVKPFLAFLLYEEHELTGAIIGRRLRPICMRYGP